MDDLLDRVLKERLANDPFPGRGFDERLKSKIDERLNDRSVRRRERLHGRPAWQWPAAALVSFSVLLLAVWLWGSGQHGGSQADRLQSPELSVNMPAGAASVPSSADAKKYALLLGLRADIDLSAGFPVSKYRTLLIAADQHPERLRLMAELPSLYMPYGQHFWQIAAAEGTEGRQILLANQASGAKADFRGAAVVSDTRLSEQVAYAGNAYLSVHTYYKDEQDEVSVLRRVKHIEELNVKAAHPADDPHTSPGMFLPELKQDDQEWIIYRNPGAWVSELHDSSSGEPQKLLAIPQEIVQHDSLSLTWEEILKTEPAARDAFTYGNLLGIVTDREILVYAVRDRSPSYEPVRIPLAKDEQVIMIQWAQNDKIDYVEKWTQILRSLGSGN